MSKENVNFDKANIADIDIGLTEQVDIFNEELANKIPETTTEKKSIPNPAFEDMEEEETEHQSKEQKEAEFYETLDEFQKEQWDLGWRTGKFDGGKNRDGSTRKSLTAEEWAERSNRIAPIANERARTAARENAELKKQVQQLLEYNKKKEEREFDNISLSLDREEEDAILMGDIDKVREIRAKKVKIVESKFDFETKPEVYAPKEEDQATFNNWVSTNNWYYKDQAMRRYAEGLYDDLKDPNLSLKDKLLQIEDDVRDRFADKLGSTRKSIPVNSGMRGASGAKPKTTAFADLPAQAREACEKQIKLYKYSGAQAEKMRANYLSAYKN